MIGTPAGSSVCTHCQKTFNRAEHLRRHVRSVHDEQGPLFRCGNCGKTFNRSDSCRRHEQRHRRVQASVLPVAKRGDRIRRACRNCAKARTKCTGETPCGRCEAKELSCTYATKPHRQPVRSESAVDGSADAGDVVQSEDEVSPATAIATSDVNTERSHQHNLSFDAAYPPSIVPEINPSEVVALAGDESFSWNDGINWLPVADNVDFSLLFSVGLEPTAQQSWQPVTGDAEPRGPLTASSYESGVSDETTATGRESSLYADGRGGRRSLLMMPKSTRLSHEENEDTFVSCLEFPSRTGVSLNTLQSKHDLDPGTYSRLVEHFYLLCTRQVPYGKSFTSEIFPSCACLSRFVGLYLREFHRDFPFVQRLTWCDHTTPWVLILAAVTMGSSYDSEPDSLQITAALREYLRRAVRWHLDTNAECDPLPLAQAALIHAVIQSGNLSGNIASAARHDLELAMEFYEGNVTLFPLDQIDNSQPLLKWQAWIFQESHVRLNWFSWLLQALTTWTSPQKRHVALPDQHLTLPCESAPWEAISLDDWLVCMSTTRPMGKLLSSMQSVFVRHRVPSPLDSFAQVLLTYVILARTDEVAKMIQQPLHAWSPGPGDMPANGMEEIQIPGDEPVWLPANHRFAAWRNSACDALDVLHWDANANVAKSYGSEGPIILHLHLVRLLLLCPYRSFVSLAMELKRRPLSASRELPIASQLDEAILRWLTMDDHKGRLSIIHSGAMFWHIRRYARGHFYEPFSIYLAALTIWIYGVYLPQVRGNLMHIKRMNAAEKAHRLQVDIRPSGSSSEDEEDDLTPKNILLDRPCDDEMVQVFVRRGHSMQADMSGAPDICLSRSQKFVLQEAIKLLQRPQYKNAGQSRTYRVVLQRLLQFS